MPLTTLTEFERTAIRTLVGGVVSNDVLDTVLALQGEYEPTGGGYFITLQAPLLDHLAAKCCSEPFVMGTCGDRSFGFVVYVGGGELLLDAHYLRGKGNSDHFRQQDVVVQTYWPEEKP